MLWARESPVGSRLSRLSRRLQKVAMLNNDDDDAVCNFGDQGTPKPICCLAVKVGREAVKR